MENNYNLHIGQRINFQYNESDFHSSPLFTLNSTGNSQQAFLENKGSSFSYIKLCSHCGLQYRELNSPLVINTAPLKNRLMVNADTSYWVISEKMAGIMEDWKLTGYQLEEVIHKGSEKNKYPAYRIIPANTLPKLSREMKYTHFVGEDKQEDCSVCGLKRKTPYPYHYNKEDLDHSICDINQTYEWRESGSAAYKPLILSKRFRELLIEHKMTRAVYNGSDANYGSKDWWFEPIIFV